MRKEWGILLTTWTILFRYVFLLSAMAKPRHPRRRSPSATGYTSVKDFAVGEFSPGSMVSTVFAASGQDDRQPFVIVKSMFERTWELRKENALRSPPEGVKQPIAQLQFPNRRLRNLWMQRSIPNPPNIIPHVLGSGIAVITMSLPPVVEFAERSPV